MKKKFFLTILFLTSTITLFAQIGTPTCGSSGSSDPSDPDGGTCPIDTWVVVFAAVVLIATTVYLYRKQANAVKLAEQ